MNDGAFIGLTLCICLGVIVMVIAVACNHPLPKWMETKKTKPIKYRKVDGNDNLQAYSFGTAAFHKDNFDKSPPVNQDYDRGPEW